MASFTPPSGPPPPQAPSVPEGWKAQYDEHYKAWFYIDLATGKSQWEVPSTPPSDAPPSYDGGTAPAGAGDKKTMSSNNPYNPVNSNAASSAASPSIEDDAKLAAKLQAEEDARARGSANSSNRGTPGAASDYYAGSASPQPGYVPASSPLPEQKSRSKGGFLSKLIGKASGSSSRPEQYQSRPQYASYPQQQQPYQQQYQQPYQQYAAPGPGYGYAQQPQRRQGGGMGTAGAAALGVGGGLLGGMLIADALEDHNDYGGGGDYGGGDYGGDYGGGGDDFGGGGDFGGGDF